MTIDKLDFKRCLGSFATGVTVITTDNTGDNPCGVTVNAFSSLSLSPPLVLFSLDTSSYSHNNFQNNDFFTINILNDNQENLSQLFSQPAKLDWQNISYSNHDQTNCPMISNCTVYITCKKIANYPGGDHTIFIGEVISLSKNNDEQPLLYYQGKYHKLENQ